MDWIQVLTVLGVNVAVFLWSGRLSRNDYLHLDKKLEENRKETNAIIRSIQEDMKEFNTKLTIQDQEFKMRLCSMEEKTKGLTQEKNKEKK